MDYTDFKTGVDPAVFASPEICSNATLEATPSRLRSFPLQMKAYLPFVMHREALAVLPLSAVLITSTRLHCLSRADCFQYQWS